MQGASERKPKVYLKVNEDLSTEATQHLPNVVEFRERSNKNIYKAGIGCKNCYKGYIGRIGVFEFLPFTDNEKSLLAQGKIDSIETQIKNDKEDLYSMALNKLHLGITSLDEIYRVISY